MAAVSEAAAPAVDDDDAATVADDDRAAERRAIDAFAAVLSSCDGFALEGLDDDGLRRMKRGKMLHGVIALKFPATKREDLRTMAREWVRGMLETTYPLEKRASRSRFAGPGDGAVARDLAACYDAAAAWAGRHLVPALGVPTAPGPDPRGGEPAAAGGGAVDEREAKKLLEAALADGSANFDEVVGEAPAPESGALTVDLWESLNWRRGALRYYVATVRCGLGPKDASPAPEALAELARDLAPELEAGVAALCAMLDARGGDAFAGSVPKARARSAVDFGVYGTTHLLGLAYAGELCYVRSLAGGEGAAAWRDRALKLVHRYVFVVEVLMEGCGWSVDRPKELIGLLGGEEALEAVLRSEWADAPAKVAPELRRLALRAAPGEPGADAPPEPKKKGKKGKKGRG